MPDGNPIRLTSDETDESEPAFSPDSTHIAFRSEQNGRGIYVIDALGGSTPSLIAPKGPRTGVAPGPLLFSAREHTGNIWTRER